MRAQITAITPGTVDVGGVTGAAAEECKKFVLTNQHSLPKLPTLEKKGSASVVVTDGVKLGDAPMACQGMTWTTNWDVKFQAVR